MKRLLTILCICTIALYANAALSLWIDIDNVGDVLNDTTIVISDFQEEFGEVATSFTGNIHSDETTALKVTITRQSTESNDSFCPAGQCINSNGQLRQEINFTVTGPFDSEIIVHYYPVHEGTETIAYTFSDGINPDITLTVDYVYEAMGIQETIKSQSPKGIYTILGQRIAATNIDELPKGIYIVNGKKLIKQ